MTFENRGPLKTSPPALRKLAVSPSKMYKRSKRVNSLPANTVEQQSGDTPLQYRQSKTESSRHLRRYSCPSAKALISPVYRDKRLSAKISIPSDVGLNYPIPTLNFDLSGPSSNGKKENADTETNEANGTLPSAIADITSQSLITSGNGVGQTPKNSLSPQWRNTLSGMRSARRFSLPVTTLEKQLETALTVASRSPKEKNEAELIETRRGSLEDNSTFSSSAAAMLRFANRNGGAGAGRLASLKVGRGESLDRELRSLYMNSMHERRLRSACQDLDRQSFAGVLEHRNLKQQISKQHAEILKRSPTADDWLSQRKCRTASLQERERETISRRFSRRARHFRAPRDLQEKVSNIRSVAMFQAGMFDLTKTPPSSPAEAVQLLRRIAAVAGTGGGADDGAMGGADADAAIAAIAAGNRKGSSTGEEDRRAEGDDELPAELPGVKAEQQNPLSSRRRKSVCGGEMAAAFRHLQGIPTRVAESGLSGLLHHSRRMSLADDRSLDDMLQDELGLYQSLLEKFAANENVSESPEADENSEDDQNGSDGPADGEHTAREISNGAENAQNEAVIKEDKPADGDIHNTDDESGGFSDLDEMSSDSEEEQEEK